MVLLCTSTKYSAKPHNMFRNSFNNVINKAKSKGYIIEFNENYKCIKCSNGTNIHCDYCYGTGKKATNVIKIDMFVDKTPQNIPGNSIKENSSIEYYKDIRHLYISGDYKLNTNSNVSMITIIVDKNNIITDIFIVESVEPIVINNEIVYYSCVLSNKNINNSINRYIYQGVVNKNKT